MANREPFIEESIATNGVMINNIAQQFADLIKMAVLERQKAGEGLPLIAQIENGM